MPDNPQHKTLKKHLIEAGLIFLIALPAAGLFCLNCWGDINFYTKAMPFSGIIWVVLWKGNEIISELLERPFPWIKAPLKRLIVSILALTSYTVLAMTLITYLYLVLIGANPGKLSFEMMADYSRTAVVITLIIATILSARSFFLSWRAEAVEHERLKKEAVFSRFESLKRQLNPHFLFNSLSVLTNLVYEDPDRSAAFIKQLSNVYRYVLDTQDQEVVSLQEELAFARAFVYLQQTRFGEHLRVNFQTPDTSDKQIPPLVLQMLLENAVKHNEISALSPLTIEVKLENDWLSVRNNLKKKEIRRPTAKPVGLKNIQARYALLSDRKMEIERGEDFFLVRLPVLKL